MSASAAVDPEFNSKSGQINNFKMLFSSFINLQQENLLAKLYVAELEKSHRGIFSSHCRVMVDSSKPETRRG